jgi:catechol 2,3-dioxygenase-like lactoylglutathione lyase family enzyme
MDVTHLHLHVRDRARSLAFYRRWFGLAVANQGDAITFLHGDRRFLFALMDDPAPAPMPAWFHFGVRMPSVADVERALAAMREAGVPIVKPLYRDPELVSFRCADPDAYAIEVYWSPE